MKKILLSAMAIALLAGCAKEESAQNLSQVEISLSAGINNLKSRAAIDAWADTPVSFAKGAATSAYNKTWDATVASTGAVTFDPIQYYPATAAEQVFLKGYAPRGTFSEGIVTFAGMNGTQDILLSGEVSGGILDRFNQASKEFTFNHCLAQLNFTVVADHTFVGPVDLTSIKVNGTRLPVSMNIASGAITYASTATAITSFTGTQAITQNLSQKLGTVMVEPGKVITLTIVAGGVPYDDVAITIDTDLTPKAGTAYTIKLTFKSAAVELTTSVTPWTNGTGAGEVE